MTQISASGLVTSSTSHSQWNLTAGHVFGWAFVLCGGFFCMCSWRGGEAGFQASWASDLIRSGTWRWLGLLRGGWPGSPAGGRGSAPRALPGAGPAGIAACQTWTCKTRPQLGSGERGVFRQLWGFTQIARPALEDTTCAKLTLGRKWKNKSGLIKLKKKKLKKKSLKQTAHSLLCTPSA